MMTLLFLTLAPLLVLLVTYGDRSRTAHLARAGALGALSFFWLLVGIVYFIAAGVSPIFAHVSKEAAVIVWLLIFATALWGVVWSFKQASKALVEKFIAVANAPYEEPAAPVGPPPVPCQAKVVDVKRAEERLSSLLGGDGVK